MRVRWYVMTILLGLGTVHALLGQGASVSRKPFRDQVKTTQDGAIKGWLVEFPWPDQDDVSQSWRTVAWTLVIAKHGKVVRRIQAPVTFWSWNFWNGGREVVIEEGHPHGTPWFTRRDITSGRELESWEGDIEAGNAPAWVKAAVGE